MDPGNNDPAGPDLGSGTVLKGRSEVVGCVLVWRNLGRQLGDGLGSGLGERIGVSVGVWEVRPVRFVVMTSRGNLTSEGVGMGDEREREADKQKQASWWLGLAFGYDE